MNHPASEVLNAHKNDTIPKNNMMLTSVSIIYPLGTEDNLGAWRPKCVLHADDPKSTSSHTFPKPGQEDYLSLDEP